LTVNAAIFDIEWSGIQQPVALPDCGYSILVNNGAARSRGGELEIQAAVAAATRISFGTGYTDARITDSGASDIVPVGTRIQQVPKWTSHAALDYALDSLPLSPFFHGEYDFVGASFSANNSVTGLYPRPEYSLVNLRAGCHLDAWQLTVFADNVFDKRADFSDSVDLGIGLPGRPRVSINRPRTVGLDARLRF
jgi:iron complex outermembrane receptor protein